MLGQKSPVVEVVVHPIITCLVDVAKQPAVIINLTQSVDFWKIINNYKIKNITSEYTVTGGGSVCRSALPF